MPQVEFLPDEALEPIAQEFFDLPCIKARLQSGGQIFQFLGGAGEFFPM